MKEFKLDQSKIEPLICDLSNGLSEQQISQRIEEGLTNKISKTVSKSYGKIIFDNLFNFFNLILIAVAIFMIVAGAGPQNFMFAYLLLINIAIGLFQDIKARKQVDKLKVVSYPTVTVIRGGKETKIPANMLVLSDIVVLKTGDQIVADSTLLEGFLEVNESLLTGESLNIKKAINDTVFSGSFVTSGKAKVRVNRVGKANYAETLQSKAKNFKRPKSQILASLNKLFSLIGIIVVVLGVAMLTTYIVKGSFTQNFLDATLSFSGSIIAMVPIGMYLLVTLTLAVGVIRLAKRRTLVQELYCIETLARVDVLCLDKTGTITDGTMSLNNLVVLDGYEKNDIQNVLFTLVTSTNDENSTALAIKNDLGKSNLLDFTSALSFSSVRKYSATMLSDGRCFVLGAREFLNHSDKSIDKICEEYEKRGLRVLLLGYSKRGLTSEDVFPKVESAAVIVLEDHIKDDAIKTIGWFKNNGVGIRIISGDSPISVSEIAKRVGVENSDKYISLEAMPLDEVKKIASKYTVFGRVSPEQKEVIIKALQEEGHTVAMTGDGVNDILALKVADCSIAMAKGSDAAKAASHLVSMDSNFSSLPDVVTEGRRVINNLQRTCSVFLVKTIFAMIMTTIFLFTLWFGGLKYPYKPNNMYIWELLTIGLGAFFLSLQPNEERIKNSFMSNILTKSVPGGIIQVFFALVFFVIYLICKNTGNGAFFTAQTAITMSVICFTIISFVTLIIVSIPFDIYRKVLALGIAAIMAIFFIIDYFCIYNPAQNKASFFLIDYNSITSSNWWIMVVIIAIAIPAYFGANAIALSIQKKNDSKKGSLV